MGASSFDETVPDHAAPTSICPEGPSAWTKGLFGNLTGPVAPFPLLGDSAAVDAVAPSNQGSLNQYFASFLNDPRDVPFVWLCLGCLTTAAAGLSLFYVASVAGNWFWLFAVAYLGVWASVFLDRFILMLHCTSHRKLFSKQVKGLNQLIPWVLGPFFGETPESYFVHHMGMHHPENNLADDLSSTLVYQRDRFSHWLFYFGRFFFGSYIELPLYHLRKGNKKMARRFLVGETLYWAAVVGLMVLNWKATLVVFVIPVVMVRVLMMAGNWGQHAFVDADEPENPYKNSITCIDSRYNRRCFNDGYHIHHHVKPRCHWSDYPEEFQTNKAHYAKEDSIVFTGIDFFQVWLFLMTKRYRSLARHFVQLPGAPERNESEIIAFLKERLRPVQTAA